MEQLKIVIADDSKSVAELYKSYIEKNSDFKITDIALSSREELVMLEKYNPDIVITDIMRKGEELSGLDIILKYEKKQNTINFLIISAFNEHEVFWKCGNRMPSNVIGYLRKPINWYSLIDELKNIEKKLIEDKNSLNVKENTEVIMDKSIIKRILSLFFNNKGAV